LIETGEIALLEGCDLGDIFGGAAGSAPEISVPFWTRGVRSDAGNAWKERMNRQRKSKK